MNYNHHHANNAIKACNDSWHKLADIHEIPLLSDREKKMIRKQMRELEKLEERLITIKKNNEVHNND